MYRRILALDVGDKWIGVAHTDLLQIIVKPYETWQLNDFEKKFNQYLLQNSIELVVVGIPITMQGNQSEQTSKILLWIENIKIKFSKITFQVQDERLSSQMAKKILLQNKSKKNSDHAVAASIILENFLVNYKK